MSKNTRTENVGELVNVRNSVSFLWRVPNYSSLSHDVDHCIVSPLFEFLNTTWYICLFLNRPGGILRKGGIGLYVMRNYYFTLKQHVASTLKILKNDGSDYRCQDGKHTFEKCGIGWGCPTFVEHHQFLLDKAEIVLNDTLRIVCVLRDEGQAEKVDEAVVIGGKDECTQTDPQTSENLAEEVDDKNSILPKLSGLDEVSEDLRKLLFSEEDSDLLVRIKDQEFKVHRTILIARSPVFKAMFRNDMAEGKSGTMDIIDCDPFAFRDFLLFLYCGKVAELSTDTVFDLYFIADKYDVKNLKLKCISFLMENTSVDNFCDVITLALKHNESELIQKTASFFMEHATKIIITAKWLSFMKENLVVANELYIKAITVSKSYKIENS